MGVPFAIGPINTGGAVPATVYGQVTTIAGSTAGTANYTNNTGTAARFNFPLNIVGDASGNLFISDANNNAIREVTPAGVVTTFAGSLTGVPGSGDGTGTGAFFNAPEGMAIDVSGNIYVGDFTNNSIRKITPAGLVTTFATGFNGPAGMSFDASGNLFVAEQNGNVISKVTTGGVRSVYAGTGTAGYVNNAAKLSARFNQPIDVQVDASGNIFVADYINNAIREITAAGAVTTFAGSTTNGNAGAYLNATGTAARFNTPTGVAMDAAGNFYIADYFNNDIREITPAGVVTIVAGSTAQTSGNTDGITTAATFSNPVDIYIDNNDIAYITDGGGNNIRQMPLTGYAISATLPAGLSLDGTTGIISGTPTAAFGATAYTITAYNLTGNSSFTVTLTCTNNTANITQWRGTTNSTWTTASNWTNGAPSAAKSVEIGTVAYTGVKAQPTFSATATIKSLEFGTNNAPVLTINSGQTLTVSTGMGVNAASAATINGPGTITLTGGSFIVSGGSLTMALNANLALATSSSLTNSGTFILASDANGSASVSAIPLGSSISGTVNVQRFLNGGAGHRAYHLLSSPVTADGTNYSINYLKTSANGIYITATTTSGGFDNIVAANPSVYLQRENLLGTSTSFTSGNFRGINNINSSPAYTLDGDGGPYHIPAGNGFLTFFRGNRSATTFAAETNILYVPTSALLVASGTLNTGTIDVSNWYAPGSSLLFSTINTLAFRGFNLVGNPYPSTINFEKFNRNATASKSSIYGSGFTVPATIYFFNPVTKQYCSYKQKTGAIVVADTTSNINPGTSSDGFASNMIASGQGFFIQATVAGQTLSFRETAKTTIQPNLTTLTEFLGIPKDLAQGPDPTLRLRLIKDTLNTDEVVLQFNNNNSTKYSNETDALDLGGNGAEESLSLISSDGIKLSIFGVPLPKQTGLVVPLLVDASASGTFQLKKIQLDNLPKLYDIWIKDSLKKDSTNLASKDTYSFNIDKTDTNSFGLKRFTLIIRQNPAYAYRLLNFTATKVQGTSQVQVVWKTENEENYTHFTVLRSVNNGTSFDVLGSVSSTGLGTYSLLDKNPVSGKNLYKLKQVDINNTITYSDVVEVLYSDPGKVANSVVNVFPNPSSNIITLAINSPIAANSYQIRFMNSSGIVQKEIMSSQALWQGSVGTLQPGTYLVRVINTKNQTLVGETKFVKL